MFLDYLAIMTRLHDGMHGRLVAGLNIFVGNDFLINAIVIVLSRLLEQDTVSGNLLAHLSFQVLLFETAFQAPDAHEFFFVIVVTVFFEPGFGVVFEHGHQGLAGLVVWSVLVEDFPFEFRRRFSSLEGFDDFFVTLSDSFKFEILEVAIEAFLCGHVVDGYRVSNLDDTGEFYRSGFR